MEKILLAIDGMNLDIPALDFACYLGKLTNSKVTGVFLENLVTEERPILKSAQGVKYIDWALDENSEEYLVKKKTIEQNITLFKDACETRSTGYALHRDRGVPAREIIRESRFADVLVIDAATSFNKRYEGSPTEFVKDILKDAECPVIIAPESFDSIDEIVFAYNGSQSSVFAVKQFTYLFPRLNNKKVTIIQVNEKGEWNDEDKYNFKEWLKDHYTSINFEVLKGDTDSEMLAYLLKRKNVFVVMGAYGRSAVSKFFKHSRADVLIKTISQPIFISHY
ncbi:MAG: universal stress protein [Bacteroidota bacterium]|nr:universal stress protein [Bacteroidota bacterium]